MIPADWRDRINRCFDNAWHYNSAKAMVVAEVKSWTEQAKPKDNLEGERVSAHRLDRFGSVVVGTLLPYDETRGERVRDDQGYVWVVVADSVLPAPNNEDGK